MRRSIWDNGHNRNRTRKDLRVQNDPYVQAGVRNIHRDMRGNVISGTTAEGNKIRAGGFRVPSQPQDPDYVPAARGNVLNQRQNLHKEMAKAGYVNLTQAMRTKAKSLGITDQAFNAAAGRLASNEAVTPANPKTAPAAQRTVNIPKPTSPAQSAADSAFGVVASPQPVSKINKSATMDKLDAMAKQPAAAGPPALASNWRQPSIPKKNPSRIVPQTPPNKLNASLTPTM